MSTVVSNHFFSSICQPCVQCCSNLRLYCALFYHLILKEPTPCLCHIFYRLVCRIDPSWYGWDTVEKTKQVANPLLSVKKKRVHLFVPGLGGDASCFSPLVKRLSQLGRQHLYQVATLPQTKDDPVPIEPIVSLMERLVHVHRGCLPLDVYFVTHSLGGCAASKFYVLWKHCLEEKRQDVEIYVRLAKIAHLFNIVMIVAHGSRLDPQHNNEFLPFWEDIKPVMTPVCRDMKGDLDKLKLRTVWGKDDVLVPENSVHIQKNSKYQFNVEAGHSGTVYHPDAINQTIEWIEETRD